MVARLGLSKGLLSVGLSLCPGGFCLGGICPYTSIPYNLTCHHISLLVSTLVGKNNFF